MQPVKTAFTRSQIILLAAHNAANGVNQFLICITINDQAFNCRTIVCSVSGRVDTAESNITSLGNRLTTAEGNITDLSGTVNNIVTAGFNLIGIDTVQANNNGEGE